MIQAAAAAAATVVESKLPRGIELVDCMPMKEKIVIVGHLGQVLFVAS